MKNQKTSLNDPIVTQYAKTFYTWPNAWMGLDEDLITGNKILEGFLPFFRALVEQNFAKKTIIKHMDNLWILGSEIIRAIQDNRKQRKLLPQKLLLEYVSEDGGPVPKQWSAFDETEVAQISSYDATCKKLYKFIIATKSTH